MRYELRLQAYDMLDQINMRLVVDETPDDPESTTSRALERTAIARGQGRSSATDWTREVLETMLRGL